MNKKTNNPGIDWGHGQSNINTETGIRFGVIPTNCLFNCGEDLFDKGTDMDYENYLGEVKGKLSQALSDYFSDHKHEGKEQSKLDEMVEAAFEAISDSLGDGYQNTGDCTRVLYKEDGYIITTDSGGDAWVQLSPYFTYAQFCSPCAPGACYLTSPLDVPLDAKEQPIDPPAANKCYCLGHDWFDDEDPTPYPVYRVDTGELVPPTKST